jgi:hypothetical protein
MQDTTQKQKSRTIEMVVDGVPYQVRVSPEHFNEDKRYRVVVNGDEGHLFAWDSDTSSLRAIDDDAITLPAGLEKEISNILMKPILF